jgi:hypothetical protein
VQSCYVPWKGYFDLINLVDEFILYDDRQYTRRDWRNRNRIKTPNGPRWLTIPVLVKGRYHQRIDETIVEDPSWASLHWEAIRHNYGRTPYFAEFASLIEQLYLGTTERSLSLINRRFIEAVCKVLTIDTPISWSTDYEAMGDRSERLVSLCLASGASRYLSGPSAKAYLDHAQFSAHGIEVVFMNYEGYPEYPQLYPPFDHHVTIWDLILSVGERATAFMKSFGGAQ